jgi:hypothetical protein
MIATTGTGATLTQWIYASGAWVKTWPPNVIPAAASVNGAAINAITATAWADFPGTSVTLNMTFAASTLTRIGFGAWFSKASAIDVRVGAKVTGAAAGVAGASESQPNWGAVLMSGADSDHDGGAFACKTITCPAGASTFTLRAYVASGSINVNYPFLEVVPIRAV